MTTNPTYRPENVTVERVGADYMYGAGFLVNDFDGHPIQWFASRTEAEAHRRNRQGIIRAALTRRANKARAQ